MILQSCRSEVHPNLLACRAEGELVIEIVRPEWECVRAPEVVEKLFAAGVRVRHRWVAFNGITGVVTVPTGPMPPGASDVAGSSGVLIRMRDNVLAYVVWDEGLRRSGYVLAEALDPLPPDSEPK